MSYEDNSGWGLIVGVITFLAGLATIATFVFQIGPATWELPGSGGDDGSPGGFDLPVVPCAPELSLSRGSGPSGTQVTVSGSGFFADSPVELVFHVEDLTPSRTDANGEFAVDVVIPGTLDVFAPSQYSILASTRGCAKSTPFQLEAR